MTKREKELIDYFIQQTDKRFERVDQKLDELFSFKWKVLGAASLLSMAVSIATEVYFKTG